MLTIGFIAAMTQERDALFRLVRGWTPIVLGPFRGHRLEIPGQTWVLVTSGMGIRRAREAARCLVEMVSPKLLISFGVAGAVEADLEIGDVVMAESTCLLDQGVIGPILPLATWNDSAQEAIIHALTERSSHLYPGIAVTTRGSQFVEYKPGELLHPILEMETVGIAQTAQEKGIPLFSLRSISDGPRAPIPINLEGMTDEDANLNIGKLFKEVFLHPGIILQSRHMIRNIKIAADNAAVALVTALRRLYDEEEQ
jgi:nucleoside phosphorylase